MTKGRVENGGRFDVNGDEIVDVADALAVVDYLLGK